MAAESASATLADFIAALRASDVWVSPAESIDAHRVLAQVGYDDRVLLRDALAATLAKDARETSRFDACFDRYFQRWGLGEAGAVTGQAATADLESLILTGDAAGLAMVLEAGMQSAGAGAVTLITQRSLAVRRTLDAVGLRVLEARIAALKASASLQDLTRAQTLAEGRERLFAAAQAMTDRQLALFGAETGARLRERLLARRAFSAIPAEDIGTMQALVRRIARRLAERYGRKRRRAQRGRLDVRNTVRRSLAHEGLAFDLIWKRKSLDRPQIVVVCDVSRSVAPAAQFLLLFLYCLKAAVARLDAFAFSDRLASVNDLLEQSDVEVAIAEVLERIGLRPTDYGQALMGLFASGGPRLDRHTTVIVLGDGRCNYSDPRLDLMRRLAEQTRSVIWLNPEPRTYWDQGDSRMADYARFCRVAETCNTLETLERIVEGVLRAYHPR
jgi:hypothetical protein